MATKDGEAKNSSLSVDVDSAAVRLFEERYGQVMHEKTLYEAQEARSRLLEIVVTISEYVLGGFVTAIPALQNRTRVTSEPETLALTVGVLGALVVIAKIIRERFKPGQVLIGARFIVATLTCGIMQVENERKLATNWAEKLPDAVEFLSSLIGWVEEVEIGGLASAMQVRRRAVKYLPVLPKGSSRKK